MKKSILGAFAIVIVVASCGPSEEERNAELAKQKKERHAFREDSIDKVNIAFIASFDELKGKIKGELVKDGDFFMDYTTGSVEVPVGCVWKLGKYNVLAKKWDTVKVDDPRLSNPCDRVRLSGDGKMLEITNSEIFNTTIIINGIKLNIPAAPCSDDNTRGINAMSDINNNQDRLAIADVYLTPGTKICIPSNRIQPEYSTHGILTIEQYKLKNPKLVDELGQMVIGNKKRLASQKSSGNYPTWNLSDSTNNIKLDIIGELSNNLNWYKP